MAFSTFGNGYNTTWNSTTGTHTSVTSVYQTGHIPIVVCANSGITTDPTVTDDLTGGTYTKVAEALSNSSTDKLFVYVRDSPIYITTSPTTLTISVTGASSTGGGLIPLNINHTLDMWGKPMGKNIVRQVGIKENQASGTPAVVLSKAANTNSMMVGAILNTSNPAGMTSPSGWNEQFDLGYTTPDTGLQVTIRQGGETGSTITWGSSSATGYAAIVVELNWPDAHLSTHRHHTRQISDVYDDCFYYTPETWDGGVGAAVAGTGAAVADGGTTYTDTGHFGVLDIKTGTTTTGAAHIANNDYNTMMIGGGPIRFGSIVKLSHTYDNTDTFAVLMGLMDLTGGQDHIVIKLNVGLGAGTTNLVCSKASVSNEQSGGATPGTNWHSYEFEINADGTRVDWWVDGVAKTAQTSTTYIPATTKTMGLVPCRIIKTNNGTNTRSALIDAYWYITDFTAER